MASNAPLLMNPWELRALEQSFPDKHHDRRGVEQAGATEKWSRCRDPMIYPNLYSASGFDLMNIMLHIVSRPNPQIQLGAVDCSVALTLCDLQLPDTPIVYVSDAFCLLTGYNRSEVLGRNCRFLQSPARHSASRTSKTLDKELNEAAIFRIRRAISARQEVQVKIGNYKKNGQYFHNLLTIIPIRLDASGSHYAVGFQVEVE